MAVDETAFGFYAESLLKYFGSTTMGTSVMASALKTIENLDKALTRLEVAIDKRLRVVEAEGRQPSFDLSARNERDLNRKIAARLDQTIDRLETLLAEEV